MASTNDETDTFAAIGFLIGCVFGVLGNIAVYQEGGRVSWYSVAGLPLILCGIGAWIDGKRHKSKGEDDQTPTN